MENEEKKVNKVISRAKDHVLSKKSVDIPAWVLYIIGAVSIAVVIFGVVQQSRIWRWQKIMTSAKNKILEIDTEKGMIKLKTLRKLSEKAIKPNKEKIKEIDKKLEKLKEERKKINESVDKMSPSELLKAFKDEGF